MKRGLIVLVAVAGCATTAAPIAAPPAVPEALRLAAGPLVLAARASGVQIYECRPRKDDPTQHEWAFKAPEALLVDAAGAPIGKHYAGPTWATADGTKVVGAVKAKADAPDAGAIPWLLLDVKSAEGSGPLARATAIHRVATVGGKAPAPGCAASEAGTESRVPYKATYYFYAAP